MNRIKEKIKSMERPCFPFIPSKDLYEKTGINRKRFGLIMMDRIEPTFTELKAISAYFNIPLSEIITD